MKTSRTHFLAGLLAGVCLCALIGTAAATAGRQSANLDYNDIKVTMDGEPVALVDAKGNPVEPFAIAGTTYLPVRAVANALGLEVGWDGATHTVTLVHPEATKPVYVTRTGSKWHHDPTCNGGTYWEVPYSSAVGMGLTPCDKCVLKEGQ